MSNKPLHLSPTIDEADRGRLWLATALHGTSLALAGWALRMAQGLRRREAAEPVLEFYAEAGAPEGALYVDGRLVGHLPGVTRL